MKNILFAFTMLITSVVFGQNGEKNFIDQNYIEVIGKSEMEITPDEIYLKIVINEKDFKNKNLIDVENSMTEKLKEIGIDTKKNLSINNFTSNFESYWIIRSDVVLTKEYHLLVYDAQTAGKVFTELQKLGISNISVCRVSNSKILDYKKEVKINAIKAAQEKAKSLTMAINQDIGKAIYIQDMENSPYNYLQGRFAGFQASELSNSTVSNTNAEEQNIQFEKIKLVYSVLVRFELK